MRAVMLICLAFLSSILVAAEDLEALPLELPKPVFPGTPPQPPQGAKLDPNAKDIRPPFMAARGLTNLALGKPVNASDKEPVIGEIKYVTDGDKDGGSGSYVEMGSGIQWVQVDLGAPREIHAVAFWLCHSAPLIYHDVIVQVADDADFISNVKTLFNNDFDNSSGAGIGNDYEFYERYDGRLVDTRKDNKPVVARFVRLQTKGNTSDDLNRFTELEVWGRSVNNGK